MSATTTDTQGLTDDLRSEGSSDVKQYVTFIVSGDVFAVDMAPVQEIIRVPGVVRVPLAPDSLDGLANLRGRVLPIISLRRIFNFAEQEHDDATRAVVIDIGLPLGFVVDRVSSVINVDVANIDKAGGIRSTVNSELLTGVLKNVGGYPLVMVLDFSKLIAAEFAEIAKLTSQLSGSVKEDFIATEEEELTQERQLVSFSVDQQEYAIDIADVQEIVQVPDTIVHVPNCSSHVLGLMTLRERLLPLVSLRSLFAMPSRAMDEKSRVVVVGLGDTAVGIVTDAVSEVLRVPEELVEKMPSLLAESKELNDISQICRLGDGKRLVAVISVENMFKHSSVKEALSAMTDVAENRSYEADIEDIDDEEQLVVFQLAQGEFAVPIASVQEIVRVPDELTHMPKAPDFVEGVINLRGVVLPVIDQRKRLNMARTERNDRQRIMVYLLDGMRIGFIVDAVTEVLKIPKKCIEVSPQMSEEQSRLLGRVANLEKQKRIIQLIQPEYLLDDVGTASLSAVAHS